MRVLIVEDDAILSDGIAQVLRDRHYVADAVGSAEEAEGAIARERFDLVLLDIGLPGMDGLRMLERMRARGDQTAVLMLTARDALDERVRGLDLGADDYLVKPFANAELLARVAALMRRRHAQISRTREVGPLLVDLEARRAWLSGEALDLPRREWDILVVLLDNVERMVSKQTIVSAVCTWDEELTPNAIEVYISRLRSKLEPAGVNIRTVRGFGYMLQQAAAPAA